MKTGKCLICLKPVSDYEPDYCCNGDACGCYGLPINPCVCSEKCDSALHKGIGTSFDERRKKAGIKIYKPKEGGYKNI